MAGSCSRVIYQGVLMFLKRLFNPKSDSASDWGNDRSVKQISYKISFVSACLKGHVLYVSNSLATYCCKYFCLMLTF